MSSTNNPSSSNNNNPPSGRSPFPPTRRTRLVRPSLESSDAAAAAPAATTTNINNNEHHSPFLQGLLRYSPNNNNAGNNTTNNTSSWSPHNWSSTTTTTTRNQNNNKSTSFFGGSSVSNNAAINNNKEQQQQQQQSTDPDEATTPKQQQQQDSTTTTTTRTTTTTTTTNIVDGLPLDQLRALAQDALLSSTCEYSYCGSSSNSSSGSKQHSSSSSSFAASSSSTTTTTTTATFYASLLYAKTTDTADALLLAQAFLQAGNHVACLRVLDTAGLLWMSSSLSASSSSLSAQSSSSSSSFLSWQALLVACAALAAQQEWTAMVQLLEDACRLPNTMTTATMTMTATTTNTAAAGNENQNDLAATTTGTTTGARAVSNNNNNNNTNRILADDDDFAWQTLATVIGKQQAAAVAAASNHNHQHHSYTTSTATTTTTTSTQIHWLARICCWRAVAYMETGHAARAAVYWKKALQVDVYCQSAWNALMEQHLLTVQDAYEFLQELFDNNNTKKNPSVSWLRALYMARLELAPTATAAFVTSSSNAGGDNNNNNNNNTTTTNAATATNNVPSAADTSFASFGLDASAIPTMTSPGTFQTPPPSAAAAVAMGAVVGKSQQTTTATTAQPPLLPEKLHHQMYQDVQAAFDQLWHEHKLQQSPTVLALAARRALQQYDWQGALQFCQQLAVQDPAVTGASYVYLATLVRLGHKRVLFQTAHEWVEASPRSAAAWFAVGAYYYACQRYHVAQRHFCRATRLDPTCSEAWIAFGCAFAACDESDQALASFRAAQRLAPGDHTSLLYMGMEYVRTNHLVLGQYFLSAALASSGGGDALCLQEMGVLQMQRGEVHQAIVWLERALMAAAVCGNSKHSATDSSSRTGGGMTVEEALDLVQDPYWEPTVFNLGHGYRRTRQFAKAEACFRRCVALAPEKASTYAAVAFTKHLVHDLDAAIDYYHQALSLKSDDPFSTEMLQRALQEQSMTWSGGDDNNDAVAGRISNVHVGIKEGESSVSMMDVDMSDTSP